MAATRFTATFKVSGTNSTQGKQQNSCFFYMDSATADADAETAANVIAGLNNGKLVSVTKQIFSDPAAPFPSATLNGGSSRARLLFRSATGRVFNMTLPYAKQNKSQEDVETALEPVLAGLLNDTGEAIGDLVNVQSTQIVE